MLDHHFFNQDAVAVAKQLLGKQIYYRYQQTWLQAQIIETESYYLAEKGSHASLGYTEKRKALFMPPGTIYMYYARGGDSLNISVRGEGNAVLIKSAIAIGDEKTFKIMQHNNPIKNTNKLRPIEKLCSGQTLVCRSLGIKVTQWDQQQFDRNRFYIKDVNYKPKKIIQTPRLGIPPGRDEDLLYRFVDFQYAARATKNPLSKHSRAIILSFE